MDLANFCMYTRQLLQTEVCFVYTTKVASILALTVGVENGIANV